MRPCRDDHSMIGYYFNSSMVRLWEQTLVSLTSPLSNFNSSMVRLWVYPSATLSYDYVISIPVWYDYEVVLVVVVVLVVLDFNSSMVRLWAACTHSLVRSLMISIPVWYDYECRVSKYNFCVCVFQFQYGTIMSIIYLYGIWLICRFQFQYGTIMSYRKR